MSERDYIDTSALAKWYLPEDRSEDVTAYIQQTAPLSISSLTMTEMRSLLGRRRREKTITSKMEGKVFAHFEEDIRAGYLVHRPLSDASFSGAIHLLTVLQDHPLRTLDALHLAVVKDFDAATFATADRTLGRAASALGLIVVPFY